MGHRIIFLFYLFAIGLIVGTAHTASAQCATDTLFWVDFQNQQIPATWLNWDEDSLTDQNARPANWYVEVDPLSGNAATPNYVAASNSWFLPPGQADNWLISEAIIVCDSNLFLVWKSAPYEGPVYMDGYEVLLSTSGTDLDSFSVVLRTFAEGIDATAQSSSGTVHTAFQGNLGRLQSWRSSLSAWLGDTIYVAFRHTSTDDNRLLLDDIGAVVLPEQDAAITAITFDTPYPIVPVSQVRPMTFRAMAHNPGSDSLALVKVTFQGNRNGMPVFTATDSVMNLPPLATETVANASPFTPNMAGNYMVLATASLVPADANPGNDSQSLEFVVNDSVYARDRGLMAGSRSIGNQAGFIGQTFQLWNADTLTSISFYVDGPTGMDTLFGAVYQFGNGPGALLARTDPWPVPANFTGWVNLGLAGIDLPLGAGTYLLGLEESAGGALHLAWTREKAEVKSAWHRAGTDWASTDLLNLEGTYMIRANLGVVDEVVGRPAAWWRQGFVLSPNPSERYFQVDFGRALPQHLELEVRDMWGRVIQSGRLAAGQTAAMLDLQGLPNGLYLLVLNGRVAGRMWLRK